MCLELKQHLCVRLFYSLTLQRTNTTVVPAQVGVGGGGGTAHFNQLMLVHLYNYLD